MTEYQKFVVHEKCHVLSLALKVTNEQMSVVQNWDLCCAAKAWISITQNSRTVRNWYNDFCNNGRKIPICLLPNKHSLPCFLDQNKDKCTKIQQYACKNLHKLSSKLISEYIHDTILPELIYEDFSITPNDESYDERLKQLLSTYGLKCICLSTVYNWMEKLGFKYEE